jgi:hypothetical protein
MRHDYHIFPLLILMVAFTGQIYAAAPDGPKTPPPGQVITVDLSALGSTSFESVEGLNTRQSVYEGSVAFLQRKAIREGPWYWGWGVRSDVYSFDNQGRYPINHLQDYAAQGSLEYFMGSEEVAHLVFNPGFYFENTPTLSSWDIPFELVSGVPIKESLSGVIGINYARFYYLPLPIAGFTWVMNPKVRWNLVYPEPAVIYTVRKDLEVRIAGELIGGGFRTPEIEGRSHVEYFEYRVGAHLAWDLKPGVKITGGAGYAVEREFDYLPHPLRDHPGGAPFVHLGIELSHS